MIRQELRDFVDDVLDAGRVSEQDVLRLAGEILAGDVARRAEVDALAALDRLIADRHPAWDDTFVDLAVAHVVTGAAASGQVEREVVNWLITTLDAAGAMTDNGLRIAIDVTRAANHVDQTLMTFVLQTMQARRPSARGNPGEAASAPAGAACGLQQIGGAADRATLARAAPDGGASAGVPPLEVAA